MFTVDIKKEFLDEKSDLPDLIVIDGGKGQLSSAKESLKRLGLSGKIAIIGIAKKLESIYFPNDKIPLFIDKKSPAFKINSNNKERSAQICYKLS